MIGVKGILISELQTDDPYTDWFFHGGSIAVLTLAVTRFGLLTRDMQM